VPAKNPKMGDKYLAMFCTKLLKSSKSLQRQNSFEVSLSECLEVGMSF